MKKRKNMAHLLLYFFSSLLFMELIFKYLTNVPIFSFGTILASLFLCLYAFAFYILSSLSGRKIINYLLSVFLLSCTALLYSSQFIYFQFFKTYFSFYSFTNGGQIAEFSKDIITTASKNIPYLLLFFLPVFIILLAGKKLFQYNKFSTKDFFTTLSGLSIVYLLAILTVNIENDQPNSAYDLYYHNNFPSLSVEKLGLLTAMRVDVQRQLTGPDGRNYASDHTVKIINSYYRLNEEIGSNSADQTEVENKEQILPIDFDTLINNEKNEVIKDMHQYFSNIPPTAKNKYTGKYKGYNLIFITAEAFSPYAVHKEITPTLYKLVHEGYQFTNFYTPIWGVSTSDGEYVATTGLIPKPGVWSYYESGENYMPFAMGNQLNKLGYKTVAYHNHTFDYYRRDVSHPNMGYDYKAVGKGLSIKESWPESDLEMMQVTIPEYIQSEPFHAYYMTVSGHMQYTFSGNYIAYKNKDLVSHLPYSEQAKAYLATQIELDRALEYLLNQLEQNGVAERTLIALSADHYPYGLDKETINELAGHQVEENFELYKNTFILYTKGMKPIKVEDPASSLDIIPTLSNLLGLEYDSRLLMGRDVFSNSVPLVVFQNKSFITDKGRYDATKNKFIPTQNQEVDNAYIKEMASFVNSKFFYSAKILETDYYSKVLSNIE